MNHLTESPPDLTMNSGINRRFNQSARTYDQSASIQIHIAKKLSDQLPDAHTLKGLTSLNLQQETAIKNNSPLEILEIGCGTGHLSTHLLKLYPEANLTITDFSEPMLSIAQEKISHLFNKPEGNQPVKNQSVSGELLFQILNPETDLQLPPAENQKKYDLIASSMAIHWFENCETTLRLITNQLKPGGSFYLSTIGPDCFPEWRATLKHLNLPIGIRSLPPLENIILEETISKNYGSTARFLTELKQTGAHSPRQGYKPLSPSELRTAIARMDQTFDGTITWHIQYAKLSAK